MLRHIKDKEEYSYNAPTGSPAQAGATMTFFFLKKQLFFLLKWKSLKIQWTILKWMNSVVFSTITILYNYHLYLVPKYFHFPKRKPYAHKQLLPTSLLPNPWLLAICFLCLWKYLCCVFHTNGIIQCIALCVWLLTLSVRFSRFIHTIAPINTSLPFMTNIPLYVYTTIHLSADGHLSHFAF